MVIYGNGDHHLKLASGNWTKNGGFNGTISGKCMVLLWWFLGNIWFYDGDLWEMTMVLLWWFMGNDYDVWKIPSGNLFRFAIEHGHRNFGFTH